MTLTGFLFGIIFQMLGRRFPLATSFLGITFKRLLLSMSSLVLTEGSPFAKGFPTCLTLTGFLPNTNT